MFADQPFRQQLIRGQRLREEQEDGAALLPLASLSPLRKGGSISAAVVPESPTQLTLLQLEQAERAPLRRAA